MYTFIIGDVNLRTETINKIETDHHEYGSSGNKDVEETEILTGIKIYLSISKFREQYSNCKMSKQ